MRQSWRRCARRPGDRESRLARLRDTAASLADDREPGGPIAERRLRRRTRRGVRSPPDTRKRPKELVGTSVRRVRRLRTSPQSLVVAGSLARRPCDLRTWFPGPSRGSLLEPVWRFNLPLRARRNVRPGPTGHNGLVHELATRRDRKLSPNFRSDVDGLWIHSPGRYRMGRLLARLVAAQDGWAKPLGDFNHRWLSALFRPIRPVKDLLNGTWLGHPLHAAATDLPIGAAPPDGHPRPRSASPRRRTSRSSRRSCSCSAAAVTGAADYADTDGTARTRATVHATLMVVGLVAPAPLARVRATRPGRPDDPGRAVAHRLPDRHGRAPTSAATSSTSSATWSAATPSAGPGTKWIKLDTGDVTDLATLPEATPTKAKAGINDLVLVRIGDTVHALHAVCAHAGGPLAQGTFVDGCIECPWHGVALPPDRRPRPPRPGALRPARLRDPRRRGRRLRGPRATA